MLRLYGQAVLRRLSGNLFWVSHFGLCLRFGSPIFLNRSGWVTLFRFAGWVTLFSGSGFLGHPFANGSPFPLSQVGSPFFVWVTLFRSVSGMGHPLRDC